MQTTKQQLLVLLKRTGGVSVEEAAGALSIASMTARQHLIGLERDAAKKALGGFLTGKTLRANQIEFLNLITDHLTEHGSMNARLLYDSPYTDFSPRGVDGVFESKEVDELVAILDDVRKRAAV